ncbi:hypothetical protein GW17_00001390 [Ensete ventricosum]|nr:hypothetical protein GW17_00001390 [Ensete ventricosum]
MASFVNHQLAGLRCPPLSSSPLSKPSSAASSKAPARSSFCSAAVIAGTYALTSAQKERQKLKEVFEEAYDRCRTAPMEGVAFTVDDFHAALEKYDFDSEIGTKVSPFSHRPLWVSVISVGPCAFVCRYRFASLIPFSLCSQVKGTVFMTDMSGALVDITAKSSAYLPVQEACIYKLKHVSEAGIYPGLVEEFVIIGEKNSDDSLILSLRSIQYDLAWERCRQLQAEDCIVKGKGQKQPQSVVPSGSGWSASRSTSGLVVGGNKGGAVAIVEGLRGFVPFSQISAVLNASSSFWQSGLTLNSEGILGPLTSDLPAEGLDLSEILPAEE